jgi:uncharacterized membrane protein YjgN (DUF898 family)
MSEAPGQPSDRAPAPIPIGLAGLTRPHGQTATHPAVEAVVRPAPVDALLHARPSEEALQEVDAPRGARQYHPVTFSGSGSEYFRIWIVNLLLIFVTFGIYFPWAKVRKLRYFYGNTQVAGHALDFHGDPKRMLRGYAVVSALFFAYSMASQLSPIAGGVALLILAAIWPALVRAGQRFRLSQTSWRGLRFAFSGSMGGAYQTLLPIALPVLALVAAGLLTQPTSQSPQAPQAAQPRGEVSMAAGLLPLALMLVLVLLVPVMWWTIKRYQHGNYNLGRVHARFTSGVGSFYAVFLKSSLLTTAVAALFMIVFAVAAGGGIMLALLGIGSGKGPELSPWLVAMFVIIGGLAYFSIFWVTRPYFTSRMQNLIWNRTESSSIGFESRLRYRSLLLLGLKNWLLMIVTLGLYWPFAAIATAKLKLEAVTVVALRDLNTVVQDQSDATKDASGDAAGDVFGIDIGM